MTRQELFLSTLPARGATFCRTCGGSSCSYFYPRSPRGERPTSAAATQNTIQFLSTLPARGAT